MLHLLSKRGVAGVVAHRGLERTDRLGLLEDDAVEVAGQIREHRKEPMIEDAAASLELSGQFARARVLRRTNYARRSWGLRHVFPSGDRLSQALLCLWVYKDAMTYACAAEGGRREAAFTTGSILCGLAMISRLRFVTTAPEDMMIRKNSDARGRTTSKTTK